MPLAEAIAIAISLSPEEKGYREESRSRTSCIVSGKMSSLTSKVVVAASGAARRMG